MVHKLHLYGHPESGHAYKVALALSLSGIEYNYTYVDIYTPRETRPLAFQQASRWHEVPCLQFSDGPMIQSGAILARIAVEYDVLGGNGQLPQALEWINWEANRIGMALPQLIAAKKTPAEYSAGTVRWLTSRFHTDSERLNTHLNDRPFLLGDTLTIADIAVFGYTGWHRQADLTVGENIHAWLERIRTLPRYQGAYALLGPARTTKGAA